LDHRVLGVCKEPTPENKVFKVFRAIRVVKVGAGYRASKASKAPKENRVTEVFRVDRVFKEFKDFKEPIRDRRVLRACREPIPESRANEVIKGFKVVKVSKVGADYREF
jgi:hypothetical protein